MLELGIIGAIIATIVMIGAIIYEKKHPTLNN